MDSPSRKRDRQSPESGPVHRVLQADPDRYVPGRKGILERVAKKTGLDVPTIMDEVARIKGGEQRAVEAFSSAVETLAKVNEDPEFYNLAVKAVRTSRKEIPPHSGSG